MDAGARSSRARASTTWARCCLEQGQLRLSERIAFAELSSTTEDTCVNNLDILLQGQVAQAQLQPRARPFFLCRALEVKERTLCGVIILVSVNNLGTLPAAETGQLDFSLSASFAALSKDPRRTQCCDCPSTLASVNGL